MKQLTIGLNSLFSFWAKLSMIHVFSKIVKDCKLLLVLKDILFFTCTYGVISVILTGPTCFLLVITYLA